LVWGWVVIENGGMELIGGPVEGLAGLIGDRERGEAVIENSGLELEGGPVEGLIGDREREGRMSSTTGGGFDWRPFGGVGGID
jgi:hypothetical protein